MSDLCLLYNHLPFGPLSLEVVREKRRFIWMIIWFLYCNQYSNISFEFRYTGYKFNYKCNDIHTFFPPNPINSKSRMIRGGSNEIIKLKVPTPTLTPLSKSFLWISPSQFRYCKIFQHSLKMMMEIGDDIQFNFKHCNFYKT